MRIVSWNIHSCRGLDGRVSAERVAETLRSFSPDVIGLNEVRRTPMLNQPRRLVDAVGMSAAFQRNLVAPGLRFGNAIMSRGRIIDLTDVRLADSREPRGLLLAHLDLDGAEFTFGVTHLGLSSAVRKSQKARILEALPVGQPLILVGDFNEGPTTLGRLGERLSLAPAKPSFPAGAPDRAIDFVFHSEHWRVEQVDVPPTLASDHRPVVVDLILTG